MLLILSLKLLLRIILRLLEILKLLRITKAYILLLRIILRIGIKKALILVGIVWCKIILLTHHSNRNILIFLVCKVVFQVLLILFRINIKYRRFVLIITLTFGKKSRIWIIYLFRLIGVIILNLISVLKRILSKYYIITLL